MRRTTTIRSAISILLLASACRRGGDDTSKDALKKDTALASDLRDISGDTSAYAAAADVATATVSDSALDHPVGPVRMRTVATTKGGRTASTPAPATPARRPPTSPAARETGAAAQPPGSPSTLQPCDSPAPGDQRRCLMSYLARSDVGLDRTYQSLIAAMKRQAGTNAGDAEPDEVKRLREAQRAWLVYRDTECRRRNRGKEGPLWAPARAQCLGEFSGARQDELTGSLAKLTAR